jgi:tripartite-type tricarboxylate transporter receptor subunit TctC
MRNSFVVILCACSILCIFGLVKGTATAESFPTKPITFIVPIEAGSDGDIRARPLCEKASTVIGQRIVIVNKPGAGSTIGYMGIHDAKPDGYTIGMATVTIITNKLQGLSPYDHHSFTPIGTFYTSYNDVFASTKSKRPFSTIEEAISFAKANPKKVSIATGGIGQSIWIGAMAFITGAGISLNVVPQEGAGGLVVTQMAGGHVDLGVLGLAAAKPQIEAGNIRLLAVLGPERMPGYDAVPTMKELGYDAIWGSFGIVIGPPKIPTDVLGKLAKAFEIAANDPQYKKFILDRITTPFYLPPEKMVQYLDERRKTVRTIMNSAGILKEK